MTNRSRYWADHTTEEFAGFDPAATVVLLPVSATEQHGPHLPVSVDHDICTALVERLVARLPVRVPLLVLPALPVGVSIEHGDFPGTLSLSAETMIAVLMELAGGVAAAGFRKLALLNCHGGNPAVLDIVAHKLRRKHELLVFPLNGYRYWQAESHFGVHEAAHGIHGGAAETAIMQAVRPGAVRQNKVQRFASRSEEMAQAYAHLRPFGRTVGFGWQAQDLNPAGAVGDATLATPETGARLLDEAAEVLVQVVTEIGSLPLDAIGGWREETAGD
ncbi:MAG: creatininase family protein [Rhodospirillaceae bacterium]|nr:creatininase family protein [Rhodospirillaceae bacterium]MYB15038.1 creatininase family protein [Rhodospirillaceae bacterium]MYI48943.1 creatininase family protein [Rhodospirillaceae bacterium]